MVCPECNGRGEAIYFVETDRDENTVTMAQRKGICRTCNGSGEKPQTNADRIRSMSDEELVVFLDEFSSMCIECTEDAKNKSCPIYKDGYYCRPQDIMKWLQKPAE